MTNRRTLLMLLMLGAALPLATPALADKGSGGGGEHEGGDHEGGDRGDHGDGNNGNGNGNSGNSKGGDGGSDDGGSDDGGDDSGSDNGNSGSNSGSGTKGGKPAKSDDDKGKVDDDGDEDDRIRAAVKRGEAAPLKTILDVVRQRYDGEVVKIKLVGKGKKMQYRIRLIDGSNNLIEVRVNAANAVIVGSTEPGLY